ncbi:ORF6N domain-containing protein [Pseudomonadota bacterium]
METLVPIERIASKIYLIRGMKVMLDRDLAELYDVETKILKRAVRRNIDRFPNDFMFELFKKEMEDWRCQFGTSNGDKMGLRYKPMAFTEQGVAMLSTHEDLKRKIESMEKKYDQQFQLVFEAIKQLLSEEDKPKKKIGYTVKEKQKAFGKKARMN